MPRTVWKQTNPRLQGNPQWDNPTYLRGCAEEAHYEPQRKAFHIPLYISPADTITSNANTSPSFISTGPQPQPSNSPVITTNKATTASSYRLDFRNHFNRHTSRVLSDLSPDDCRAFCWKDCAIYGSSPHLTGKDHTALLDEIYHEWYPHRAEDKDISDGSFFGKFMRFTFEARVSVGHIVHFHRLLCGALEELEGQIPLEVPVHPCAVRLDDQKGPELAEYKIRETFDRVFTVLDDMAWRQRGVLLVWANEREAERHNCKTHNGHDSDADGVGVGRDLQMSQEYDNDGNISGAEVCMFRCPLKRAMQIVVSTDPERAARRMEWNEMLEEMLGEV